MEILKKIRELSELHKKEETFNPFIARFGKLENTHSDLIAKFIECDKVFAEYFFKQIKLESEYVPNISKLRVRREYRNIDLLLEDGNKAVLIENKIGADDQPQQLQRYYNKLRQEGYKEIQSFYLTPYGKMPSDDSKGNLTIKCISYEHHILPWLEQCITIAHEPIKDYLRLYEELVRETINKNKYMTKIIEEVFANGEYAKEAIDLYLAMRWKNFLSIPKVFENIKNLLIKSFYECGVDNVYWEAWEDGWGSIILENEEEEEIGSVCIDGNLIYTQEDNKQTNQIFCNSDNLANPYLQALLTGNTSVIDEWANKVYESCLDR